MAEESLGAASRPQAPGFSLRVTRNELPRLTAWRRARQKPREMSPAMQRVTVILMLSLMTVWAVNSALSLRDWRPPFLALVAVGILFVGAAVLARVNRRPGQQRSNGLVAWLDGCPDWFEGVVLGLVVVILGTGLYGFLASVDEATAAGRGWAFDPLLVFVFGGLILVSLLQMRRLGSGDEQ